MPPSALGAQDMAELVERPALLAALGPFAAEPVRVPDAAVATADAAGHPADHRACRSEHERPTIRALNTAPPGRRQRMRNSTSSPWRRSKSPASTGNSRCGRVRPDADLNGQHDPLVAVLDLEPRADDALPIIHEPDTVVGRRVGHMDTGVERQRHVTDIRPELVERPALGDVCGVATPVV